jgi:hypothetical protein
MITKRGEGEGGRLLEIDNVHVADCGLPPSLDAGDKYVGYFESPHGEQWVFIGDPRPATRCFEAAIVAGRENTGSR